MICLLFWVVLLMSWFLGSQQLVNLKKMINDRRMVKTVMQNAAGCSANTAMHLDLQYHDWKWD